MSGDNMQIKEIIVVEGKSDTRRLKEIFPDINTIETNGSAIDERIIAEIKSAKDKRGVIILTDPDYQGEKIRSIINQLVPGCKNAYIKQELAINHKKHKVGVEHCDKETIMTALANLTEFENGENDLTYQDLYDLKLSGAPNSRMLREYISDRLNLGYNNAKQLYRKLKLFNISKTTLQKLIDEYDARMRVTDIE